jgi:DNA-binding beta-propeller fold protein YncE
MGSAGAHTLDIYLPTGLAVSADGSTYAANPFRSEVLKFGPQGEHRYTFGEFGTAPGQFRGCEGISIDPLGRLYVADTGNSRVIRLVDTGSALVWDAEVLGSDEVYFPRAVFVDAQSRLFVVGDTHTVQVYDLEGRPLPVFSQGSHVLGQMGSAPGEFWSPRAVFVDREGLLYVADSYNHRVQVFAPEGGLVRIIGSEGTGPGQFLQPRGVVVDGKGNIVVADANNHRVQWFDAEGNYLADTKRKQAPPEEAINAKALALGPDQEPRYTMRWEDPCTLRGDLDCNKRIDGEDYSMFLNAFGSCSGQARYNPRADLDHDGCVTFVDYQTWYWIYRTR